MRNLKKILALVLALMMTLSLMVTASATSYKDDDSIKYDEAVSVMSAIGVFNGTGGGNFSPNGTLKRDQAAKIIAFMKLGKGANALPNDTAPFSDVGKYWGSGPIAWCSSEGIIDGVGGGKFSPNREVTGYEFGKMLLNAAGVEGKYTGGNWQINVAAALNQNGITAGMTDLTLSKPLTREQACQMAFNALNYSAKGTSAVYVVTNAAGNETYYRGTDALTALVVQQANTGSKMKLESTNTGSLADTVFGLKKSEGTDPFDRPTTVWTGDNNVSVVLATDALATYTAPVSYAKVYKDLGLTGASVSASYSIDNKADASSPISLTASDTTNTVGNVGAVTQVYMDSTGAIKIIEVTNYLAKVTAVTRATASTEATVTVEAYSAGASEATVTGLTIPATGYTVGQYVVVTLDQNFTAPATKPTAKSIEAATSVEGVMTGYTAGSVTLGNATYNIAATFTGNNEMYVAPGDVGFANTYTYYLKDGVILGTKVKDAAVSTDYVYVAQIQAKAGTTDLMSSTTNKVVVDAIFTDGTHSIVELAVYKDGSDYKYMNPASNGTVAEATLSADVSATAVGNWFAYTVKDGIYTLSAVNADYATVASGFTLTQGATTSVSSKYTTSATKVVSIDTTYKVSGFTGLPTATSSLTGNVLYTYAKGSNVISAVYAAGQAAAAGGSSVTYAYALEEGKTVATGTEWTFAINGKTETYVISSGSVTAKNIYTLTSAANGTYTAATPGTVTIGSAAEVELADTTFFVAGSTTYTYAPKCVVYNVSSGATNLGQTDMVEEGDFVVVVHTANAASAVYIVDEP